MAYKDILVYVDATQRSDERVTLAAEIALRHGAHLTGLYVVEPESSDPILSSALSYGAAPLAADSAQSRAVQHEAEARFRDTLRQFAIPGEWRLVTGLPEEVVPVHARYADFAIIGQSDPDVAADYGTRVATRTLLTSGRPALTIPYAGQFKAVATNVLVAWNDTREAARALNDALPLLSRAEMVTVLAINPQAHRARDDGTGGATEVALHLTRHGVKAEAARLQAREIAPGDVILNRAFDLGADLLVSGAYGHSQTREFVLGGATRDLFDRMTLPVFMSH